MITICLDDKNKVTAYKNNHRLDLVYKKYGTYYGAYYYIGQLRNLLFFHDETCPLKKECAFVDTKIPDIVKFYEVPIVKIKAHVRHFEKKKAFLALNQTFIPIDYFCKDRCDFNDQELELLLERCDEYMLDMGPTPWINHYYKIWISCACGNDYLVRL